MDIPIQPKQAIDKRLENATVAARGNSSPYLAGRLLPIIGLRRSAMKNSESSAGGYIMLFGLVAMLSIPLIVGHFSLGATSQAAIHTAALTTK